MAVTHSTMLAPGSKAPPFSLPGTDGRTCSLEDFDDAVLLVVIFTCNHCPYARAYEERIVGLVRDYSDGSVAFVAINPNDDRAYPEDSFENMQARARDRGFNFKYLRDETQEVAKAYRAACTPDVYVFDRARELVCQSRIDDSWNDASKVSRQDLRQILDAQLAGEELPFEPIPSMGCSIKWKG